MDEQKEKQTKELLEVLEKALRSEAVERITITLTLPTAKAGGFLFLPPLH